MGRTVSLCLGSAIICSSLSAASLSLIVGGWVRFLSTLIPPFHFDLDLRMIPGPLLDPKPTICRLLFLVGFIREHRWKPSSFE